MERKRQFGTGGKQSIWELTQFWWSRTHLDVFKRKTGFALQKISRTVRSSEKADRLLRWKTCILLFKWFSFANASYQIKPLSMKFTDRVCLSFLLHWAFNRPPKTLLSVSFLKLRFFCVAWDEEYIRASAWCSVWLVMSLKIKISWDVRLYVVHTDL